MFDFRETSNRFKKYDFASKMTEFVNAGLQDAQRQDLVCEDPEIISATERLFKVKNHKISVSALLAMCAFMEIPNHKIDYVKNDLLYRSLSKSVTYELLDSIDPSLLSPDTWAGGRKCLDQDKWKSKPAKEAFYILFDRIKCGSHATVFRQILKRLLAITASRKQVTLLSKVTETESLNMMHSYLTGDNAAWRSSLLVWATAFEADGNIGPQKAHNANDNKGGVADIDCRTGAYSIEVKRRYLDTLSVVETLSKAAKSVWCHRVYFVVAMDGVFATEEDRQSAEDMARKRFNHLQVSFETLDQFARRAVNGLPATWQGVINRVGDVLVSHGTPEDTNDWVAIVQERQESRLMALPIAA